MISKDDKELLKAFVDNKPLMEAVRRVITTKIYEHGVGKNVTMNFIFDLHSRLGKDLSDEEYGRKVRVMTQALFELEGAFQEMVLAVSAPTEKKAQPNGAR